MPETKRRDYCFTINNPRAEDEDQLEALSKNDKVRYMIVGKEKGEEETPHFQGYIYFHSPIAFTTLKKLLSRAHIEGCKGNATQNIEYCSKDGDFYEIGDKPVSQKRKGDLGKEFWDETLRLAKLNKIEEIDSKVQISHWNSLHAIASKHCPMPPDNQFGTEAYWYYGATGTGKSRKARDENPGAYLKMCNKWWDGYNGEEVVLIEDFDKKHEVLGHHLKIWADRYAFPAEIKGSKVNLRPKKIIVTSNWHPQDIWGQEPQTLEPIIRRFNVTHFL